MAKYSDFRTSLIEILETFYVVISEVNSKHFNNNADIVITTYVNLLERINRNIQGISVLIKSDHNFLLNNRQSIMLLYRGIIDDLLLGSYLFIFREDKVSFNNEINILNYDFAKFSEFLIKREPTFDFAGAEFKGLGKEEVEKLIENKLVEFKKQNPDIYNLCCCHSLL